MSDFARSRAENARGLRIGVVSVLVAVAFLIGLALAMTLSRRPIVSNDPAAVPTAADPAAPLATPTLAGPPAAAPVAQAIDGAALPAREAQLAGQIAALEARAAALATTADVAGGEAARAEALLVAVAARRSIDRGVGLGPLDAQLLGRLGLAQPRAVAIVREAARAPVTLEELRQGLDTLGPVLTTGANRGWWDSLGQGLRTLVVLRRAGTPSPLPADRLARARRLLDQGQVEAARAEVAGLPGAAQADGWLTAARRYARARQALDLLENAALTGQARPAPATTVGPG